MFLLLHDNWHWFFLDRFEVQFLSAGKIIILVSARHYLSSDLLFIFVLLFSHSLNKRLLYSIHSIHHLFLIAGIVCLFQLAVGLVGLGLLGITDVDKIAGFYVTIALFDLEAIVPDIPKGQIFVMILLVIALITIIGSIILLLTKVGTGDPDIIIAKLACLELNSGVDLIIADVFGLVMVVYIVLLVLLLSQFGEFLVFDERLVVLKGFWFIFYEVALLGLLVAHRIYNLNLFINDFIQEILVRASLRVGGKVLALGRAEDLVPDCAFFWVAPAYDNRLDLQVLAFT